MPVPVKLKVGTSIRLTADSYNSVYYQKATLKSLEGGTTTVVLPAGSIAGNPGYLRYADLFITDDDGDAELTIEHSADGTTYSESPTAVQTDPGSQLTLEVFATETGSSGWDKTVLKFIPPN